MRKITSLITFLLAFTAVSYAQFPQGFEGATFPPAGWTTFIGANGAGTVQNWQRTTTTSNTGVACAFVRWEQITPDAIAEDWLVTPQVAITSANSNLSFFHREAFPDDDYGTIYTVRVSTTSQNTIASFTTVATWNEDDMPNTFSGANIDLSAYIGQSVYVAFVMSQDDGDNWYIDDVNFGTLVTPPGCSSNPTPADMAIDVETGDVTFSWGVPTTGGAPTGYDLYYGLTEDDVTNFVGSFATNQTTITLTGYDTTFYWMIVPKNSGGSATGCDVWSFTTEAAPAVPDNDACSTAIAVTSLPYTNTQDATSATNNSGFINSCTEYGGMNDGVWYTVVGNGFDLTIELTNVGAWDPQVDVYTGSCGTFTCVVSTDIGGTGGAETLTIPASVLGTTYYINVGHYSQLTDNPEGVFTINIISGTNDTPDFYNLQWPPTMTFTEGGSDTAYAQVYEAGLTDVEPGLSGQAEGIESWFAVSPDNTDPSTWDPMLWVEGIFNPDGLTPNNDEYMLEIGADQAPGTYYYASRWRLNNGPYVYGGYSATGGGAWDGINNVSGVMTVEPAPAPANDACATAIALIPGGTFDTNAISTTSLGASVDALDPVPSCGNFNFESTAKDVWYSVAIPPSGSVTIMTDGPGSLTDTAMEVYSGTCGSLSALECNDDIDVFNDNLYSSLEFNGMTPGEILLIRVWGYNGASGGFRISAFDASLGNSQFDRDTFRAYPNPVKDILNLSSLRNISDVAVYNLLGQQVVAKTVNASEGQIDMSGLSQGTYLVKVTSDDQIKTIKVVKE